MIMQQHPSESFVARFESLAGTSTKRRADHELRILDMVFAVAFGVLVLPFALVIALVVAMTSGLPVLYRGERVGRGGRMFTILKFRTLKRDAESRLGPFLGEELVRRTELEYTKVGRGLKTTQLDELPQLWNVLRGDMSLVGPRPKPRELIERYRSHYEPTLAVRPGLSHLPGVSGRNTLRRSQMIAMDQAYVRDITLSGDMRLLLRTIPVVLFRHGFEAHDESEEWVEDVPPDGAPA
jgi:lipopolysaccharide/colanic/teichoic acid biosynthesis glycosyltransferase